MSKTGIKVSLVGGDGNAFAILGKCFKALRKEEKVELMDEFKKEATSRDYDHLLQTVLKWFEVE